MNDLTVTFSLHIAFRQTTGNFERKNIFQDFASMRRSFVSVLLAGAPNLRKLQLGVQKKLVITEGDEGDLIFTMRQMLSNRGPVYENLRKLDDSAAAIGRVALQVLRQDAEQNSQPNLREAVKQKGTFRCEAKCFIFVDPAEAPGLTADAMARMVFPPDGIKDQRVAYYVDFSQGMAATSPMRVEAKGYSAASQMAVTKLQELCNDASLRRLVANAQAANNPMQIPVGNGITARLGYESGSNADNSYGVGRITGFSGGFQLVTPTDTMCVGDDSSPKSDIAIAAGLTAG